MSPEQSSKVSNSVWRRSTSDSKSIDAPLRVGYSRRSSTNHRDVFQMFKSFLRGQMNAECATRQTAMESASGFSSRRLQISSASSLSNSFHPDEGSICELVFELFDLSARNGIPLSLLFSAASLHPIEVRPQRMRYKTKRSSHKIPPERNHRQSG